MTQKVGLIWNPSKVSKEDLAASLPERATVRVCWFETSAEDPGQEAARKALDAGADALVVAGGDGTVRAVAEYLAVHGSGAALGIVPLGTGNLLARNLGIPIGNLPAAVERAFADDTQQKIDVGWVEAEVDGRSIRQAFAVMAGIGIDAHMITETDDDLKDKAGWLAYVESLGRALDASDVLKLSISLDGKEPSEHESHTLLIGNCGSLQGGLAILPDADPHDGQLDLLLLSADSFGKWLDTARSFVWNNGLRRLFSKNGTTSDSDSVAHRSARSVSVILSEPRILEIDGEDLGEVRKFTVEVQPAALNVR